jgi:hypothetical protein
MHGIAFVALLDRVGDERFGEALHVLDHHRRAVQLDHAQRALHLVQVLGARAHQRDVVGLLDVGLERLARLRERRVERRLDPVQGGEFAIVVQFHATSLDCDDRRAPCAAPQGRPLGTDGG